MSTSKRRRRAAKQRERPQHARASQVQEQQRRPVEPPLASGPPFQPGEELRREREAERIAGLLISAARLRRWSHLDEVLDVDDDLLGRVETRLRDYVEIHLEDMFEQGWQPLDLTHVIGKEDTALVPLLAQVVLAHPVLTAAADPPQPWPEQLRAVAEDARLPAVEGRNVLFDLPELLIRLSHLPGLQRLGPVPSQWGRVARPRPAASDGSDRSRLLDKIRALLAKAESTSFAAEAEAFTVKAQDLMTRHAVDAALLHADHEDFVEVFARRVHLRGPYLREKNSLLAAVGRANRAQVVYHQDLGLSTVVGTPISVDQVEMLFTSLLIQATRAMAEAGAGRSGAYDRSRGFRQAFLTAYAVRVGERLTEADAAVTLSYGSALVPVLKQQDDAVDAEFRRMFPQTSTVRSGTLDRRGWAAGRAAAERATLVSGRIGG